MKTSRIFIRFVLVGLSFVSFLPTHAGQKDVESALGRAPDEILLSATGSSQLSPAVAHNGHEFIVVWQDSLDAFADVTLRGTRVNEKGIPLDADGIEISTGAYFPGPPAVASSGPDFLVAWSDNRNGIVAGADIYGTRVKGNGAVMDPTGFVISVANGFQGFPAIAGNNEGYLAVWVDGRAFNPGGGYALYGAKISRSGESPIAEFKITDTSANDSPAVAATADGYLVVWDDYRNSSNGVYRSSIYGARVSNAGLLLDTLGFPISTEAGAAGQPAVAASGDNYLAVWSDGRDVTNTANVWHIHGARISPSGQVLDPNGIRVSVAPGNQVNPAVAGNAQGWLAVWENLGKFFTPVTIFGGRVHSDGRVQDEAIPISVGPTDAFQPAVAAGKHDHFLVVHPRLVSNGPPKQYLIVGQFVAENFDKKDAP
jgi:hypothetical protein